MKMASKGILVTVLIAALVFGISGFSALAAYDYDQDTTTVYIGIGNYQIPEGFDKYKDKPVIDIRPLVKPMLEVLPYANKLGVTDNSIKCFIISYDDLKKNAYKIGENDIIYDFIPTAGLDKRQVLIAKAADFDSTFAVGYANHKGEVGGALMYCADAGTITEYDTSFPSYFDAISQKMFKNGMEDVEVISFGTTDEDKIFLILKNPLYKG